MTYVASVHQHAEHLLDWLVDNGPASGSDICAALGWTRGRFDGALRYARAELCDELGVAIPTPIPPDHLYQVTTDWEPVEAGAAHSLGQVESRLRSIARDVRIVLPALDRGSKPWRRANFLDKHLTHLIGTLEEIENG